MGDDVNGTTEGTETHGGNAIPETDVKNGAVNAKAFKDEVPGKAEYIDLQPTHGQDTEVEVRLKMGQKKEQMSRTITMKPIMKMKHKSHMKHDFATGMDYQNSDEEDEWRSGGEYGYRWGPGFREGDGRDDDDSSTNECTICFSTLFEAFKLLD